MFGVFVMCAVRMTDDVVTLAALSTRDIPRGTEKILLRTKKQHEVSNQKAGKLTIFLLCCIASCPHLSKGCHNHAHCAVVAPGGESISQQHEVLLHTTSSTKNRDTVVLKVQECAKGATRTVPHPNRFVH